MTLRASGNQAATLLVGRTVHRRERPFERRFSYAIAMIALDIDRVEDAAAQSGSFRVNRPGLYAFRESDHGFRSPGASLREWATVQFAQAGLDASKTSIRLVTFPRVLGYGFAPISVWLSFGPDNEIKGAIHEVHNTFGETHAYVQAISSPDRGEAEKSFHVSPFFGVDGRYRFTLRVSPSASDPLGRLELIVENIDAQGRSHVASLMARSRPLTTASLAAALVRMPFSGLGVMAAIHWQALLIWLRGGRYHDKPEQSPVRTTLIQARAPDQERDARLRKRA